MSPKSNTVIYLLLLCFVVPFHGVYILSITKSLLKSLFQASLKSPRLWPGTLILMRDTIFELKGVDWHMNII